MNIRAAVTTILLSLTLPISLCGQQLFIKGYIYSSDNKEPLLGAHIYATEIKSGVSSNEDGFFVLSTNQSKLTLEITYIGFESRTIKLSVEKNTILHVYLDPLTSTITEVVVSSRIPKDQAHRGESVALPMQQLEKVPALLGETDVLRAMALTPGVQTGAEGSVGLFVRGGTPDQNLILLDGTPIYNTSHLFGFLSVFNPDAISHVNLIRGGFPAKFGGRLSSIVEISAKEGNKNDHRQEYSVGLVSTRLLLEGPIQKGKSSYVLAGRASYLSLLSLISKNRYDRKRLNEYQTYFMYDLNAKITHELGPKDKLSLSFYNGKDNWGSTYRSPEGIYTFDLNWGGPALSARYVRSVTQNMFLRTVLSHNQYALVSEHNFRSADSDIDNFTTTSKIRDLTGRIDLDWSVTNQVRVVLGQELSRKNISPNIINTSTSIEQRQAVSIRSASTYSDLEWTPVNRFSAAVGLRQNYYSIKDGNARFLEPRMRLSYGWSDQQVLQLNYSTMSQPLHLLYSNGVGLPNDIWIPSSTAFPPGTSRQFGVEYRRYLGPLKIEAMVGAYYKKLDDLVSYRPGIDFQNTEGKNWEELIDGNGKGRSFGIETLIRKNTGQLTGWLSYSWSKTERLVPTINEGKWYPFKYDRRHDLAITGAYALNEHANFSATFELQSGFAITLPESIQLDHENKPVYIYKKRNNARMPVFHKLDLSYSRSKITDKGNERTWTFGVYNVYGRRNPFYVSARRTPALNYNDQQNLLVDSAFSSRNLVGILPFISYSFKFK